MASQFGIQQAERYHLLERTFQFLAENPEAAREPWRSHRRCAFIG
jgi:hypothetical protein